MKKTASLIAALILFLALCACVDRDKNTGAAPTVPDEVAAAVPQGIRDVDVPGKTNPGDTRQELSLETAPVTEEQQRQQPEPEPESEPEPEPGPETAETASVTERGDDSWKLILVNADHPLPEDFTVELMELRNDQYVDVRIYPELQQMFDDARAVGIYPLIGESFRTAERQQQIMDNYIAWYESTGMSREEAESQARKIVALPGTSEHQLGLALDINAEFNDDSTATYQWLRENCSRYGFILRYPEGKEEITGISYEPWHFRYVGVEAAEEIMRRGICLEEYIDSLGR